MSYKLTLGVCRPWNKEEYDDLKSKGIDLGQHIHMEYPGQCNISFGTSCLQEIEIEVEDITIPNFADIA